MLAGFLHFETLEAFPFNGNAVLRMRDLVWEIAEDGVVLKQVRESQRVRNVIDRHELHVPVIQCRAHDVASDTAKAIDAYFAAHFPSVGNWADSPTSPRASAVSQNSHSSASSSHQST